MAWLVWGAAAFVTAIIVVTVLTGPTSDPWDDDDHR